MRGATLLLSVGVLSGVALATTGCGSSRPSTPAELKLQREDLIAVVRELKTSQAPVAREVASAKVAWSLVVSGLPANLPPAGRSQIAAAGENAAKIKLPVLMEESQAATLTGPASQLAGVFRTFVRLATRGWALIGAGLEQIEHGSPTAARFARENVALYIESVYDGHFDLAQLDKKLHEGYRKLGGPTAFGGALTQSEVDTVADAYSETSARLHPHVGARLGS